MYIIHDYHYVSTNDHKLIDSGYGKMSVHSLHFDRHFSEEQMEKNRQLATSMTTEEWNKRCEQLAESFDKPLREILNTLVSKYDIHQVSEETSTMEHYRSDWDMYFWSNRGWNNRDYMDRFSLTFNENRSAEQNMKLLEEIVTILKSLDYENIECRIQYTAVIDKRKVEEAGKNICESLIGKFIDYCGMTGKIKVVKDRDGNIEYGFFKKNARNKYYPVSYEEIVAMNI